MECVTTHRHTRVKERTNLISPENISGLTKTKKTTVSVTGRAERAVEGFNNIKTQITKTKYSLGLEKMMQGKGTTQTHKDYDENVINSSEFYSPYSICVLQRAGGA